MANRLVKLADVQYLPAIQEVIGRPARCVSVRVRIPTTQYSGPSQTQSSAAQQANNMGYQGVSWSPGTPTTAYRTVTRTTCYPAIQGVPGRDQSMTESSIIGWDAGGESIGRWGGDIRFSFLFRPDGAGMLCGLAPVGSPGGEYGAIHHGLQYDGQYLAVVERGREVARVAFSGNHPVVIRRVGSHVTYETDGWAHQSDQPSVGFVSIAACLYVSGDYIDDPLVSGIRTIQAWSGWEWEDHTTRGAISAFALWGWGVRATIGDGVAGFVVPVSLLAYEESYGEVRIGAGGVGVSANDNPIIGVSGVAWQLPYIMDVVGSSVVVGDVSFDAGGPAMLVSDYGYGECRVDVGSPAIYALSTGEAPGVGSAAEALLAIDRYVTDPVIYAVLNDGLRVGGTIDVLMALDAGLVEYLVAGDDVSATMVMSALLASNLKFSDNIGAVRAAVLQYTTNLLTGGVGRYEGFDFSGFVRVGMDTYGWKRDGLYRLGYAEDTGEQIQAMIEFAAEDFDTTNRKSIRALFFGVDTDGALYARLVDDNDCDATYRVIPHGDTQRANPAQRPTSRFWRLRLEIVDATFADLDNVEWKVATTGRRTRS